MPRDHFLKENAMAKKDGIDEKEPETEEQAPKENAMAKKAPEPFVEEASTDGLVKMHKDGTTLHVHPTAVKAHISAGWKQS
jgi:hypothetical protein